MADVVLFYMREDEHRAMVAAEALERMGLRVTGAAAAQTALAGAHAALVLWSAAALRSTAMREAVEAAIPTEKVVVARLDHHATPPSFWRLASFSLEGWGGDVNDPALDGVMLHLERMAARGRDAAGVSAPGLRERADADPLAQETQAWRAIQNSTASEDFIAFLERFGEASTFGELATLRLKRLQLDARAGWRTDPQAQPAHQQQRAAAGGAVAAPITVSTWTGWTPSAAGPAPGPAPRPAKPPSAPAPRTPPPPLKGRLPEPPPRPDPPMSGWRMDDPLPESIIRPPPAPPQPSWAAPPEAMNRPYQPAEADAPAPRRKGGFGLALLVGLLLAAGAGAYFVLGPEALAPKEMAAVEEEALAQPAMSELAAVAPPTPEEMAERALTAEAAAPPPSGRRVARVPTNEPASAPAPLMDTAISPEVTAPLAAPRVTAAVDMVSTRVVDPNAARVGRVIWEARPSADDLRRLFPRRALEQNRSGRAELRCTVLQSGTAECEVAAETPTGLGFGQAALRAAQNLKAAPQLDNGAAATGAAADIAIVFQAPTP